MCRLLCLFSAHFFLLSGGLAYAQPIALNQNSALYSGPGVNYSALGSLQKGLVVNILSCDPNWCRVISGEIVGFVPAGSLGSLQPEQPPIVIVQPQPANQLVIVSPGVGVSSGGVYGAPVAAPRHGWVPFWRHDRQN
jgi:uncharacterized protein YraI